MVLAFFLYQAAGQAVVQGSLGQRIQGITVADIMDREPVTVPAGLTLLDAQEQFFLRYRWPWFAVVDPAQHFLGVVREARIDEEIAAGRPALSVVEVLEPDLPVRIGVQAPLESLLGSEGLGRLGAMVAVDTDGVLQGVVTLAQVRQALRPAGGTIEFRSQSTASSDEHTTNTGSHASTRRIDHRRRPCGPARRASRRGDRRERRDHEQGPPGALALGRRRRRHQRRDQRRRRLALARL